MAVGTLRAAERGGDVRDYTPEYESFRDDAVALVNGSAIVVAIMGTWTRPLYLGPIALVIAIFGYFLSPRSRGGTILAVVIITILALILTWLLGHSLT
jgi:hypothetical protein